jgi:tyrosine-protein phosphatase YwqE
MLAKIFKSLSGTKNNKVPEFYTTDLHSHLIPSIDDGSESMEQSLEMLQELSNLGFQKLITTPHTMSHRFPNTKDDILNGFAKLKDAVTNRGIPVELEVASEYYFDEHFLELIEEGDLLTFGDNYVLFELSYTALPFGVENGVFKMMQKGYKPVLAHPERYATFQNDHKKYEALKDTGLLFQLNVNSLDGFYGKSAKRAAEFLVDNGMVDFVGSDTHRPKYVEALKETMSNKNLLKITEKNNIKNYQL